jgi:hypothetical protein
LSFRQQRSPLQGRLVVDGIIIIIIIIIIISIVTTSVNTLDTLLQKHPPGIYYLIVHRSSVINHL